MKKELKERIFMSESKKELKDLEDRYFMLQMQDHWEQEDYRLADELQKKIKELKNIDNN